MNQTLLGFPVGQGRQQLLGLPSSFQAELSMLGLPRTFFSYTENLDTFATDFNLRTGALAAGWDGRTALLGRLRIGVNGVQGASSNGLWAADTGTIKYPPGSIFIVENAGLLIGKGGNANGGAGGPALRVNLRTLLDNSRGVLGGGGGGGGYGGAGAYDTGKGIMYYGNGGGGGGGRGYTGGAGGGLNGAGGGGGGNGGAGNHLSPGGGGGGGSLSGGYGGSGGTGGQLGAAGGGGGAAWPYSTGAGGGGAAGAAINGVNNVTFINGQGLILGSMT